jgi:hypothetical protein
MFGFHPNFETPEGTTQVWRYMDFVGFVWMLQNSALWFSRADYFEDKWEGAYPEPTVTAMKEATEGWRWEAFSKHAGYIRKTIFINCWYGKPYESSAMWQQYAGFGNSIAIRSTVTQLINSLDKNPKIVHVGKVKYIDYLKDSIEGGNIFSPYLRKRKSFEHESEVRLIMWSMEAKNSDYESNELSDDSPVIKNAPVGVSVSVDLTQMIDSVFISPKAKPWFVDLVREVISKYNFDQLTLKQSDFDASPPS